MCRRALPGIPVSALCYLVSAVSVLAALLGAAAIGIVLNGVCAVLAFTVCHFLDERRLVVWRTAEFCALCGDRIVAPPYACESDEEEECCAVGLCTTATAVGRISA